MPFEPDSQFIPDEPSAEAPTASPLKAYLKLGRAALNLTPLGGALAIPEEISRLTEKLGTGAGEATTDYLASSENPNVRAAAPIAGTAARLLPDIAGMLAGGLAGRLVKPGIEAKAADIMQSALKPTAGQLERDHGQAAVQTALDEGISASKGGLEKLQGLIDPIEKRLEAKLQGSTAMVPETAFGRALQEVVDKARFAPPSESRSISKVIEDFKDKFYPGGGDLPVQYIQKIKRAYYNALGPESYGVIVGGEREGMKAIAKGAKEAVAGAVPGVQKENDALGPLLTALDVVERRVNLAPNRDIGGLAWIAHSLKGMIAALAARDPYTKSLLARGLHSGVAPAAPGIGAVAGAGIAETARDVANR